VCHWIGMTLLRNRDDEHGVDEQVEWSGLFIQIVYYVVSEIILFNPHTHAYKASKCRAV